MKTSIKTAVYTLIVICLIACTIGVSHKIIVNSYGDDNVDSAKVKSRDNKVIIYNYSVDTTDIKKAPNPKK